MDLRINQDLNLFFSMDAFTKEEDIPVPADWMITMVEPFVLDKLIDHNVQ